ncbi:class I SAM-dependent methyltransferase [Candidatus Methanodesulfokora washburnensis]|jgi:SAM-dependent methyltransferase|uniref:Class I SAM-dependent methyltransferase n=1 Tax=Candidatus Methanodesulfokora washburnensis TaxID=2478471 RepID=A0A3R9X497_9CREN|nr:class I SAM-dependent methyltransferase [Candidatus Methanodesulfokores washburnensis]RSN74932.1 class I SAM-dependent methyltransferase [Candidatus Methanodesulfokores washburnensis]
MNIHQLSKNTIKTGYENAAEDYDAYRLPWIKGPLIILEGEILRRFVKGESILEVGCGTGRIARYFVDDKEYFGIDISHSMVRCARRKYNHNPHLILSDAEMMCFREGTFESLFLTKVFKFLNPSSFLEEAKRILKKNGRLLLIVQVRDSAALRLAQALNLFVKKQEKRYYTQELIKMLKKAGFKPIITVPVANVVLGFYLFIWYLFYPISPLRRIMSLLTTNSRFIRLIVNLDKIVRSKFLVLIVSLR